MRAPTIALAVSVGLGTMFLGYLLGGTLIWWVGGVWEAQHAGGIAMAIVVLAVNGIVWQDRSR